MSPRVQRFTYPVRFQREITAFPRFGEWVGISTNWQVLKSEGNSMGEKGGNFCETLDYHGLDLMKEVVILIENACIQKCREKWRMERSDHVHRVLLRRTCTFPQNSSKFLSNYTPQFQQIHQPLFSKRPYILFLPLQIFYSPLSLLQKIVVFNITFSMDLIHNLYQKIKIVFQNERKEIWLVKNIYDGQLCIVKLQYHTNESKKTYARTVLHQGKFLQNMLGYTGIPFMHWAGREEVTGTAILIVERLGKTLQELFNQQEKRFSVKTVCLIGIDLIKMVHTFHDKGITHGNLKPTSIQFGVGKKCNQLFFNDLIDSDLYIKKGRHIKQKQSIRKGKINQFLSIDRLQGYGGSRRDDIESIIYMLIFFLKGSLPWSNYFDKAIFKKTHTPYEQAETQEQTIKFNQNLTKQLEIAFNQSLNQLLRKISDTKIEQICQGVPNGLKKMLQDCRATQFDQRPDYNSYIRNLQKILHQNGYENDTIFDWMVPTRARLIMKKDDYKQFSLKLRNEKAILYQCYEPFEDKVHLS